MCTSTYDETGHRRFSTREGSGNVRSARCAVRRLPAAPRSTFPTAGPERGEVDNGDNANPFFHLVGARHPLPPRGRVKPDEGGFGVGAGFGAGTGNEKCPSRMTGISTD